MTEVGLAVTDGSMGSDQQVGTSVMLSLARFREADGIGSSRLLQRILIGSSSFDEILFQKLRSHGLTGSFRAWANPALTIADIVRRNSQARRTSGTPWYNAA